MRDGEHEEPVSWVAVATTRVVRGPYRMDNRAPSAGVRVAAIEAGMSQSPEVVMDRAYPSGACSSWGRVSSPTYIAAPSRSVLLVTRALARPAAARTSTSGLG